MTAAALLLYPRGGRFQAAMAECRALTGRAGIR